MSLLGRSLTKPVICLGIDTPHEAAYLSPSHQNSVGVLDERSPLTVQATPGQQHRLFLQSKTEQNPALLAAVFVRR